MRQSWIGGAALLAALAGCSGKIEPTPATPEMEAEQRQAEQEVRAAETENQKAEKLRQNQPTPADGELEEREYYKNKKGGR